MDELDNILSSPSENPVETQDVEETNEDKATEEKEETDSNKLEVEDQENENSSDKQVDDDAQVPQDDEEQEDDKKEEEDQYEAQNAKDDEDKEDKDEESEGETKKKRKHKKKEKKSKKDKKERRKKKKKDDDEEDNLKSKIFGDSDEEEDDQDKDADFDTADVDEEEAGKRALEEIIEKKKEKKKKRSRDDKKKSKSSKKRKDKDNSDSESAPTEAPLPLSNEPNDFDLVIESLKKGHRRRKSDGPPEGADEFVRSFVHRMDIAAEEDIRANQQHLPALNKVKLLPEVGSQLAKKYLHDLFIGSGVLNTLKKWLDPLPDGSLPNIKVREIVLQGLLEMGSRVQTEDLRESGIGRAVMVLSKHPNETLINKKNAKTLIELWSRPIFNLSSKYRDLHREERYPVMEDSATSNAPTSSGAKSVKAADLDHSSGTSASNKNAKDSPSLHAKIPDKIALDFKVMPKANEEAARLLAQPKKGGDAKGFAKKSPGNKNKIDRAVSMSVEGRGVYR